MNEDTNLFSLYFIDVTAHVGCEYDDGVTWVKITVNDTNYLYEKIFGTENNAYLKHTNCLFVRDSADDNFKLSVGIALDENGEPYQVYPVIDSVSGIENDDADCFIDYVTNEVGNNSCLKYLLRVFYKLSN